jgi:hypothetical protein
MSTDRELLELAAKAAGIEGEYESWTGQGFNEGIRQVINGSKCLRPWNPLTDDGDALRLAVKLRLLVNVTDFFCHATNGHEEAEELHEGRDEYAANRRAIVRAAAEIGRTMP